jgi:hypothetical protein
MCNRTLMILSPLLITLAAGAQTVPAAGLCNTGLTKASAYPKGCSTSTLVAPVNPETGGTSVDGNWQLATPYPSGEYNEAPPSPCSLEYGPAWVDQPWFSWFNPDDGLSQYIMPEAISPTDAGGWFIYRTALPVPPAPAGSTYYILTVNGQTLVDNELVGIFIENPAQYQPSCRPIARPAATGFTQWTPFTFSAVVVPSSHAYLYFVTYNAPSDAANPTGMRVEFTSASLAPE